MFIATRLVIITQNVEFSMRTARSLEQPGAFTVTPFTSAENALAYLRENPQDVVLLDLDLPQLRASEFVQTLRRIQPDTGIVVMPDTPVSREAANRLDLQGVVDTSYTARRLVPVLKAAQKEMYEAQPDTVEGPAITEDLIPGDGDTDIPTSPQPEPSGATASMELVLTDEENGDTSILFNDRKPPEADSYEETDAALEIFSRLAAEEPPVPSFEEGGTISDLMNHIQNPDSMQQMPKSFRLDDSLTDDDTAESDSIPAALILEEATDDSTPLDQFSLTEFLSRIQDEAGIEIKPLPSWVEEDEKYVQEPDFLPDQLPELDGSQRLEYTAPTTTPSEAQDIEPGDLPTDLSQPVRRSRPVHEDDLTSLAEDDIRQESEMPAVTTGEQADKIDDDASVIKEPAASAIPEDHFVEVKSDDPYIASLALTLTQMSLELTAEATVLIQNGQIVAHAGVLPIDDVEAIYEQIPDNLEAAPRQGRIRFLTMPGTGMDYMLYSRGTEQDFTLSLIFSGTIPLHAIRRQGKRLEDALLTMPETPSVSPFIEGAVEQADSPETESDGDDSIMEPVDAGPTEPMTFVWMLRDPDAGMKDDLMAHLRTALQQTLMAQGWQIHTLTVYEDFVYLFADVPGEETGKARIRDLMQQSAGILSTRYAGMDRGIWADSYLILTPGREMTAEELQDFIHFVRI